MKFYIAYSQNKSTLTNTQNSLTRTVHSNLIILSPSSHNQNNLAKKRGVEASKQDPGKDDIADLLPTQPIQSNISTCVSYQWHHRHHHDHFNLHDQHTCDHHHHNHHNHHHLVQAEVTPVSNLTIQDLHLWRKRYCIC